MKYPKLKEIPASRELVDVFKGYNHNLRIGDGEFYDMINLSSDNYPLLSPRPQRGIYAIPENPQGIAAKGVLCYVDGKDFVIDGERIPMDLTIDKTPKNIVSMGAYIIIMPDKKYINTVDKSDYGTIETSIMTYSRLGVDLCKADGTTYENLIMQTTYPQNPQDGDVWIDTSESPYIVKEFSSTDNIWSIVKPTYVKLSTQDIGVPFSVGELVVVEGLGGGAFDADTWVDTFIDNPTSISAIGEHYIVVEGVTGLRYGKDTVINVTRKFPDMDFIIESENRLWGCRYGKDLKGEMVNEIYASKLGDFKSWRCFKGISTDSYAVSVGTDGPFTGAVNHLGHPLFFKENCIHKIYGDYPANYRIQTTTCRGVQEGCSRSLSIVNEVLYYKARSGICAYDGSLPVEISSALGEMTYSKAVAGTLGNKYYISMSDSNDHWHLFVYDTLKGMWHREDDTQAVEFCNAQGELYYIDYADKKIKAVKGTGITETAPIKWQATTGIIGTNSPDKKYISRMDVRMHLEVGTRVSFYAEYDSSGEWEFLFAMDGINLRTFAVPIKPKRCDHMRLKIIGKGDAKIFSICKTTEQGSDV